MFFARRIAVFPHAKFCITAIHEAFGIAAAVSKRPFVVLSQPQTCALRSFSSIVGLKVENGGVVKAVGDLYKIAGVNRENGMSSETKARVTELVNIISERKSFLSNMSVGKVAWSLATLNYRQDALLTALRQQSEQHINDFTPVSLAWFVWALSKYNLLSATVLDATAQYVMEHIARFSSSELSLILIAFQRANYVHPQCLSAVTARARALDFHPRSFCSILWCVTELNFFDHLFVEKCGRCVSSMRQELSRRDLMKTLTGLSKTAVMYLSQSHNFTTTSPSETSATISETISTTFFLNAAFERLHRSVVAKLCTLSPFEVSSAATSFSRAAMKYPDLMNQIAARFIQTPDEFNEQSIVNLTWAFARLNMRHEGLLEAVRQCILSRRGQWTHQGIAVLLWSFVVLQEYRKDAFETLLRLAPTSADHRGKEVIMLYQVHTALQVDAPADCRPLTSYLQPFMADIQRRPHILPSHFGSKHNPVSFTHQSVSKVLDSCGIAHVNEFIQGAFIVDIALPEKRIAIEIVGPGGYTRNTKEPLGSTLFKRRILSRLGWRLSVIENLHFFETQTERRKHIMDQLVATISELSPHVSPP